MLAEKFAQAAKTFNDSSTKRTTDLYFQVSNFVRNLRGEFVFVLCWRLGRTPRIRLLVRLSIVGRGEPANRMDRIRGATDAVPSADPNSTVTIPAVPLPK
jgi:hypothetical protein